MLSVGGGASLDAEWVAAVGEQAELVTMPPLSN